MPTTAYHLDSLALQVDQGDVTYVAVIRCGAWKNQTHDLIFTCSAETIEGVETFAVTAAP
jgi:hypothetical protein